MSAVTSKEIIDALTDAVDLCLPVGEPYALTTYEVLLDRIRTHGIAPPDGWVMVPTEPTEEQWGGLARDIIMWWSFDRPTGASLFKHLSSSGRDIPNWLRDEIKDTDHVPPKGTIAAVVYKAMLNAAKDKP